MVSVLHLICLVHSTNKYAPRYYFEGTLVGVIGLGDAVNLSMSHSMSHGARYPVLETPILVVNHTHALVLVNP